MPLKPAPIALTGVGVAAAVGFASGAFLFRGPAPGESPEDVSARCAVYASDTARANSILIKCGLDRASIEEILDAALASLGIDASRPGEIADTAALQAAADRLNVTIEALAAALDASAKEEGGDTETPSARVLVEITDEPTDKRAPTTSASARATRQLPRIAVAALADQELVAKAVGRVELDCAVSGGEIIVKKIALDCGPNAEEVEDLVQRFVDASGAEDLRQALLRDESARAEFVRVLAEYYHLEEQTVDAVVAQLAAADSPWSDEAGELDAALRARMERALAVVRVGQVVDLMQRRQTEIAGAIVSGETERADAAIRSTGAELRPVADDFAPIEDPPIVIAARVIEEAEAARSDGAYGDAADAYVRAANLMSRSLLSDALRIWAVESVELSDRNPADYLDVATEYRLRSAESLAAAAVRSGIDAAAALRLHGSGLLDDGRLDEARTIIERLAASADPGIDLQQHFEIHMELARLTSLMAGRDRDPLKLRKAATSASIALNSARSINDATTARALITSGNTQLDLVDHLGERSALDAARDAYREAADLLDIDADFDNWSAATANLALVQRRQSFDQEDPELLEDAIATYRDLLRQLEKDSVRWQGVTTNLAVALLEFGAWVGEEQPIREAIRQLESVLEGYEAEQNAWNALETRQRLAAAWRLLARLTQDERDLGRAADRLAEMQAVEGIEDAIDLWVRLKLEQARLREEFGRISGAADEYLAAATLYAEARERFDPAAVPLLYSELALEEAWSLRRALNAGAADAERDRAESLANRAIELADAHGAEGAGWSDLRNDAEALIEQLGLDTE